MSYTDYRHYSHIFSQSKDVTHQPQLDRFVYYGTANTVVPNKSSNTDKDYLPTTHKHHRLCDFHSADE